MKQTYENAESCKPAQILRSLYDNDCLSAFKEAYCEHIAHDDLGNCHEVAMALMSDLVATNNAYGWTWVAGFLEGEGKKLWHSWLEYDGWVIDASRNVCFIVRPTTYSAICNITKTIRRNPRQSRKLINKLAKKEIADFAPIFREVA